jgi:hypothetical protein
MNDELHDKGEDDGRFFKAQKGDIVSVHCCDSCARNAGVPPKVRKGDESQLCEVCGHHNFGSLMDCEIDDWLRLRPLRHSANSSTNNNH